ncbi:MAG: sugar transferase [Nakamurella sp.]
MDLAIAIPALVVSLPVQATVAAAILLTSGRPVLFRQIRPGLYGKPFTLRKFRTMRVAGESEGWISDADRLTPLGRWLRSTSLDELPSLVNIIRAEMSLVGPRPLLMEYLDRYTPAQARRHQVRPGLTGLAQVAGRNRVSWEERFRLDVEYVESASPRLDLRIIWRTMTMLWKQTGISAQNHATMPEFIGHDHEQETTVTI